VLASELYAIAHGFDISAFAKFTINKVLRIELLLVLCINSKLLYKYLVKLGTPQEKRLIIDIIYLRQTYKCKEIVKVKWIKGKSNLVNAMTKSNSKSSNAFKRLINTNTL
jgi:hypothetical protein